MYLGILAGVITGALWGLTFLAPRTVDPFSTADLTFARYMVFGAASLLLMIDPRFRPWPMAPRRLATGLLLGLIGYVGYFSSAANAVRYAGAVVPPLIIGTMPVLLAMIANWRDRSVPWRALTVPLGLILAGVMVVNVEALVAAPPEARADSLVGVALAFAALAIWVVYGLINAAVMRAPDAPGAAGWTCLQGIGAALGSVVLVPFLGFPFGEATTPELWRFAGWTVGMGILGAWVASWCWMVASHRLPLALSAQLVVTETVFGLGYGLAYEQRWPSGAETAGIVLQLVGVVVAVAMFARARRTAAPLVTTEPGIP